VEEEEEEEEEQGTGNASELMDRGPEALERDDNAKVKRATTSPPVSPAAAGDATSPPSREAPEDAVPTHADNPAIVDELGRQSFAKVIAARIRAARGESYEAFLVHLHGPWGAGKTSLLNFLAEELHDDDPRWVVVRFNAWEHQRIAPPWWWLMTALYQQALHELPRRDARRLRRRELLWRLRGGALGYLMVLLAAVLFVIAWRSGTLDSTTLQGVIVATAAILAPVLAIWGAVRGLSRWALATSARLARTYVQHAPDPLGTLRGHFGELVCWIGAPIAILIDDLDRCKSPYVVELLEGIQTLFRDVPVTYVIAADRAWLSDSYESEYDQFTSRADEPGRPLGYLFLEKTFQISANVPSLSDERRLGYWERLIEQWQPNAPSDEELHALRASAGREFAGLDTQQAIEDALRRDPGGSPEERLIRSEQAAVRLASRDLQRAQEHALGPFDSLLEPTPRAMKRLVNAYGIQRGVQLLGSGTTRSDRFAQQETALWTILSMRWPVLGEHLAANSDDITLIGQSPPDGAVPEDLRPLFTDKDVIAVAGGDAKGVDAELTAAGVRRIVAP
jgi:hypothetical protein